MKAILLAAGFGKRLGKLTEKMPKCLMKVGEETMLNHWLLKLNRLGVEHFFINTHYLAEQVEAYISNHPMKKKITLLHEPELLGTARTITHNLNILEDEICFIVHADNYCFDTLDAFLSAHQRRPNDTVLSMLTFTTETPEKCGIVEVDECNRLTSFYEKQKSSPTNRANAAVFIASKSFFSKMKKLKPEPLDISCDIIPALTKRIYCHHTNLYFEDIGTEVSLDKANKVTSKINRELLGDRL